MKAREYYFEVLAPEEGGKTYQAHQASSKRLAAYLDREQGMGPSELKRWTNWRPVYSNDILLQGLTKELISIHRDPLRKMLKSTFIAKRRNKIANAGALARDKEFTGDIVVFYVGLSDAAFQYSTLYRDFMHLREAVRNRDYDAPKRFAESAKALSSAQHRWNKDGYVQLAKKDLLEPDPENEVEAATVATTTDLFILGHELAHHYLGHTSSSANPISGLATFNRPKLAGWNSFPPSWRYELDADSAAVEIVLGATRRLAEDRFVTAALGALLTMTVLGQMYDDVDLGSDTHPPNRLRQNNIVATLRSTEGTQRSKLDAILADVTNFQRVLYRQQGRGLGKPDPAGP